MEMYFESEGKCMVDIHNADGFVTVMMTEISKDLLKNRYEDVATMVYKEQLKGKVDPLSVIWLGHIPQEGRFEVLMQWHSDQPGYGQPHWYKRKAS